MAFIGAPVNTPNLFKQLAKQPLALPREMIERAQRGADRLTDIIPHTEYTDDTIYILFHGNANAAYAVWDRIRRQEKGYSPAMKRTIDRWIEFNQQEFTDLVGESRNDTTHQGQLPKLSHFNIDVPDEYGEIQSRITHWFRERHIGGNSYPVLFGEWMMEVWAWWGGRINQLERMYHQELATSGDAK